MKAFVYLKSNSKKIAEINKVQVVRETENNITFYLDDGVTMDFSKKLVKTTTYQN